LQRAKLNNPVFPINLKATRCVVVTGHTEKDVAETTFSALLVDDIYGAGLFK